MTDSPVDGGPATGSPVDGSLVDGSSVDGGPVDGSSVDGGPATYGEVAGSGVAGSGVAGGGVVDGPATGGAGRAFLALLSRDVFVTGRELPSFLAQVILQPLFLLFVFGRVLADLGYTRPGYSDLLFPGIVALTAVLTALQATALPLVIDFSFLKEIEDRLLAPLPIGLVAVEKIVFATMRALIGAALMFPIGVLVLGSVPWRAEGAPLVVAVLVLGALTGSALGMTLGTLITPNKINIVFALVLTPLLFTGATQYPWTSLSSLRWFQVVTACNPLTYVSEGMRAALEPGVPHLTPWICLLALLGFLSLFTVTGIRGFARRAVD
jgi:ABC-2 type transport system permease protein